jgi:hypothetical protein
VPRAARICKSVEAFLPITTSDTLSLVLDALSTVTQVNKGSWLTPRLAESLVPALLNTWVKNVQGMYGSSNINTQRSWPFVRSALHGGHVYNSIASG